MKKKEINTLLLNYLIPFLNNYLLNDCFIYKKVINNLFIQGYYFESSKGTKDGLTITWFLMPLFIKKDYITITYGNQLYFNESKNIFKSTKNYFWEFNLFDITKTTNSIIESINKIGDPILNKIDSVEFFYNSLKKESKDNIRMLEAICYSSIYFADINFQNKLFSKLQRELANEDNYDWVKKIKDEMDEILTANSNNERNEILTSRINYTCNKLKLS